MMLAMKDYCPVLYVQEPHPWHLGVRPRDEKFFWPRYTKEQDNLGILQLPKCLAFRAKIGNWNRCVVKLKGRQVLRKVPRGDGPLVLYLWEPQLVDYAKVLQPDVLVYHMFDLVKRYYHADYRGVPVQDKFQRLCRDADIVLAGTPAQAEVIPRDDVQIFPNAVRFDWYRDDLSEPEELKSIKHPRIGYIGSINSKLDFGWFEKIAANPKWQLIIAGKTGVMREADTQTLKRICQRENVHFLGQKPADKVPNYMMHLDVGLLNYRRGTHMEYASPLKLSEYSAAGLPIIASPVQALSEDPWAIKFVRFVDHADQLATAIAEVLAQASDEDRRRRREFASGNSWQVRGQRLVKLIQEKNTARGLQDRGTAVNGVRGG
jgi:glycosyltransferase involved in cell wall biosynthesis